MISVIINWLCDVWFLKMQMNRNAQGCVTPVLVLVELHFSYGTNNKEGYLSMSLDS